MNGILKSFAAVLVLILCIPGAAFSEDILPLDDSELWRTERASKSSVESKASSLPALKSIRDIENLYINEFPGGAVLTGNLLSPEDMRRVALLSSSIENVFNLCTYDPEALAMAAAYIIRILKKNGVKGLEVSTLGSGLLLTGTPAEEGDISKVQRICEALNIPLTDGTHSTIADPRMVYFEVSFIEVNKDVFQKMGFRWPSSTLLSDPNGMSIARMGPAASLELTLDHQVLEGNARIISRPRLVCASGRNAAFQAGGEIPIPRTDKEGQVSVTWKPYGIILEITPSIDSTGRINVEIRSEVSMVDHANAVENVPGILTRKVQTFLSLQTGQTIVLSGMVHSDDAKNMEKIPLLGDIPVIGELFKSRSFQKRETELVVFLTPLPVSESPHIEDINRPTTHVGWPGYGSGRK